MRPLTDLQTMLLPTERADDSPEEAKGRQGSKTVYRDHRLGHHCNMLQ